MRTVKSNLRAVRYSIPLLLAVFGTAAVVAGPPPKPPRKEQRIIAVSGAKQWVNTGIRLGPRDRVTVSATGKVCFSNGEKASCVDPDGWGVGDYPKSWPYNWNYCDDPVGTFNHAALIANVGASDFLVGRRLTFSGKDGVLYLGINDCTFTGDYHNTGEFSVVVVIEHDAVPAS
jgi:hypothetical protein